MSKVLVTVAAHADDVELNAGGTVAKWAAEGGSVHIVMVSANFAGEMIPESGDESAKRRLPPIDTAAIRRAEQEASAALIGAKVHYLDYAQRHYWDGRERISAGFGNPTPPPGVMGCPLLLTEYQKPEHFRTMGKLLTSLKPEVVLTQGVLDVDPEHHAVCSLVWLAFHERREELKGVTLRFWTPGSSCMWGVMEPGYDHFEDITDHYETKLRMCACHKSQMTRTRMDMVRERAERYGVQARVRYAEPFNTAKNWDT